MKKNKYMILLIVFVMAFGMFASACQPEDRDPVGTPDPLGQEVGFIAQYIRTNGYHEDVDYPVVTVIESVDALNTYYEENQDRYDLAQWDVTDRYDEAYFTENVLLLVLLEEGSGSNRHEVTAVMKQDDGMEIAIDRILPEIGTADMAEWHIFIEVTKSDYAPGEMKVSFEDIKAEDSEGAGYSK
jgi:hypothetical protein